ncbi:MAG TPA: hypothetical protein VGK29_11435 [Paludibaculum sp.]
MQPHFVITAHGIRTFGEWQERLETIVALAESDITFLHYKYGVFSALAFIVPFLRGTETRRFARYLEAFAAEHPGARIDIVAHSFGTEIAAKALKLLASNCPRIHTLILAGSVLPVTFPWYELQQAQNARMRVVNDCGTSDFVLIATQIVVLGTGMAGNVGFNGLIANGVMVNRYHRFGHSGYFKKNRRASNEFMAEHWLPLLTTEGPPISSAHRCSMFLSFLANNAEPVRLGVWVLLPILLTAMFFSLYIRATVGETRAKNGEARAVTEADNARKQRVIAEGQTREAQKQRNRSLALQLAAQSDLLRSSGSDSTTAALLAAESMLRQPLLQNDIAVRESARLMRATTVFRHHGAIERATFSPDGKYLATSSKDNYIRLFSASSGRQVYQLACGGTFALAFAKDGRYLFAVTRDNRLLAISAKAGGGILSSASLGQINGAVFSADARHVVVKLPPSVTAVQDPRNAA